MSVNLTRRQDTGRLNSSPLSSITPVVRLQYGCNHTLVIPVTDPDSDTVRCRWAVGSRECGDVCGGFLNAVLDEATCTITYQAKYQVGWYAVALMIEDFASPLSTSPLSQIPLQFLVEVYNNAMPCSSAPYFIDPTPKDGACIAVPENETYFQTIVADSGMEGSGISDIVTVSPFGFSKSEVVQVQSDNRLFYVNLTWTPTKQQEGENILCFTAENTEGVTGPQTCIKLVVGVTSPAIVLESLEPNPGAEIVSNHSTWRMKFDKEFVRPTKPTFIRFYDGNDSLVYSIDVSSSPDVVYQPMTNRSITFMTNGLQLLEKQSYYILMDAGVATGLEACGSESSIIRDRFFWTFTIYTPACECLNGGTCLTNNDSTSTCQCPYGFVGPTCKRVAGYCACAQP
ncbi:uncharacterized protein LOC117117811 [Anneissia japonica]|uniref:uncharacterized protein LOC117117811 n=1 Tax=Anneissia japonica TaxID=1529436 RepID=UPI00142575E2|nr:uncharacterized protein LOC117117811 [Anneissia japonica]